MTRIPRMPLIPLSNCLVQSTSFPHASIRVIRAIRDTSSRSSCCRFSLRSLRLCERTLLFFLITLELFASPCLPVASLCRTPREEIDFFYHENSTVLYLLALVGNWIGRHRACDRPFDRATHGCSLLDFDRHRNLLRRWSDLARTTIQKTSRQRIIAINVSVFAPRLARKSSLFNA